MTDDRRMMVFGVAGALLVSGSLSLVVYYRQQGESYLRQLEGALAEAGMEASSQAVPQTRDVEVVHVQAPAAVAPDVEPLKARIAELESQLAEKEGVIASLRSSQPGPVPEPSRREPDPVASAVARTNDVARRAEFEKRREEFQQKMQNSFARKAAFLLERDTSKLPEEERKQHEKMVALLDETWKLSAQMQGNLPMEQRHEVMHAVRDNITALAPMLASERTREFRDLGVSLGYNEEQAAQFVAYLSDVIDVTSVNTLFPMGRGRRSGGGLPQGGKPQGTAQ